ncbi:SET domain-containing protein SmydA-8 [Pieris rapae]|uniref:SET domain-containing protein SmydA-8 n=1 Tax=Pieris rapae TaxID=64459 RepID=UPI001E280240|nr:SET domain-containing protein SmydA-8 [Pieris rapae]
MDNKKRKMPACEVCQQPANQTCGGCKSVFYCSRNHQKTAWKEHKFQCRLFEIQFSNTAGRYLVATRDIKQGEIILREKAAVSGPRTACTAHCLSCNKKLEPMNVDETLDYYKCSGCYWPMCGLKCEKSSVHEEECKLMSSNNYKSTISYKNPEKAEAAYCVIAPLRMLLLKTSNPEQYNSLMSLESHVEKRINTQLYSILKTNLVTFIVQVLKLPFDEDTILKVAGILDTNSFDVRSPDGVSRFRAIYATAAMINHNCTPNTRHIYLGDDYTLALIATVPIAKGETLTATYTQVLLSTLDRRKHLYTAKYFHCDCERCKDETEFDTYLGSIYCSLCAKGKVEKKPMMLSTDPLNETAPWKCGNCGHCVESRQMFWGNNALKQDLNKMNKKRPEDYETFIKTYSHTLHQKNHLVVQAKLALMQIYGSYEGYGLSELSDELLERKVEICHELLEIADKLEPGWSKFRGSILLELQGAMVMQTKRDFEADKITKSGAQEQLMESMVLLQEAVNILKVEPHMKDALEEKVQELSMLLETTSIECS